MRYFSLLITLALCVACTVFPVNQPITKPGAASSAQIIPDPQNPPLAQGLTRFEFANWGGETIPVYSYVPSTIDPGKAPILFMMHGAKRGALRYLKEWIPYAQAQGFIVVAPLFTAESYPKSRGYNLGNVFEKGRKKPRKEAVWSFSAIEPLFDVVVGRLSSDQTTYTLYGHSAGSQFVHRFLFYKPNARVKRFIAANAGWYTLPNFAEKYPYGLKKSGVSEAALGTALAKDVVVILGDQDIDAAHKSLRRTPEAIRQGPHRFARGQSFFDVAKDQAEDMGVPFNWRIETVEGVAHSNGGMAKGAAELNLIR